MARSRTLRLWGIALWTLCLLATTGAQPGGARHAVAESAPAAAAAVLSGASDAAVLPVRAADEVRGATHGPQLRILLLAAVLVVLVGLPAALRRRSSDVGHHRQPLRARRPAIALRAPPLQFV